MTEGFCSLHERINREYISVYFGGKSEESLIQPDSSVYKAKI